MGKSPPREAQLPKLAGIFKKAHSPPRITARRGGGVTKKIARSLLIDAAGVVFLVPSIGIPPRPRESGCSATFLDRSATPPRGDARRGMRLLENARQFRQLCLTRRGMRLFQNHGPL